MNEGWKCPECGRVNAPWVQQCDHEDHASVAPSVPGPVYVPVPTYVPVPQPSPWFQPYSPPTWPYTITYGIYTTGSVPEPDYASWYVGPDGIAADASVTTAPVPFTLTGGQR